jgi:hypothetical protein
MEKKLFTSIELANRACQQIKEESGDVLVPYHCECGGTHIGHVQGRIIRIIE